MNIDFYILTFSAVTVAATIWMGFRSAKKSKTASDFFVAGRSVSVGWNASAISGEYLSAASFMGIAGMVMSSGYDALWYPVCYACGYLFLLLFIAGPLRRFGAYTIPDFAEGRFDSPVFRKIAVVFVLFIGFFYTMPQMKGAGTTLAYIFPGLPYWAGVVLVGAVITLNVALGGMKGITLVQAFQYWAKMFAISVPIFVLMAVYGHYGKQVGVNAVITTSKTLAVGTADQRKNELLKLDPQLSVGGSATAPLAMGFSRIEFIGGPTTVENVVDNYLRCLTRPNEMKGYFLAKELKNFPIAYYQGKPLKQRELLDYISNLLGSNGISLVHFAERGIKVFPTSKAAQFQTTLFEPDAIPALNLGRFVGDIADPVTRKELPQKAPADATWLNPFGPLTTKAAKNAAAGIGKRAGASTSWFEVSPIDLSPSTGFARLAAQVLPNTYSWPPVSTNLIAVRDLASHCAALSRERYFLAPELTNARVAFGHASTLTNEQYVAAVHDVFTNVGAITHAYADRRKLIVNGESVWQTNRIVIHREPGGIWLSLAGSGAATPAYQGISLRHDITPDQHLTVALDSPTVAQALAVYAELTGRKLVPNTNSVSERVDDLLNGKLSKLKLITRGATPDNGVRFHNDGMFSAGEVKSAIEEQLKTNGLAVLPVGEKAFAVEKRGEGEEVKRSVPSSPPAISPSAATVEKAWLAKHEKPLALLYTYSLIIAIVCGTAGLPHILVRFYTNPDGAAAKRTTMWVMILIGVFYLFPPVFGALGRNLMPDLYNGVGAKGTDKIVLELPRILNAKYPPLGSILSGITCAGAFAAFMSTFSGLLVSMTGALAHDVYGRILRPKSTPEQRMKMFKIGAVILGGVAIVLGSFVEKLEINFMVGQAFAIAASSYFPLLFMAVWWRKLTMKGAAAGMLGGGLLAMVAISLTSFSTLAAGTDKTAAMFAMFKPLNPFWADHPLARILCEQPAIWAVPLAITLMIIVSKLTAKTIPSDIRMKMLVLHAPEQLGLKQEYIQEHQGGGH